MVVMDKTVADGMLFVNKYRAWDELSIGGFYRNEHAVSTLVGQPQPGVPHLIVYRDIFREGNYGIKERVSRQQLVGIVGGDRIVEWVASEYPFEER